MFRQSEVISPIKLNPKFSSTPTKAGFFKSAAVIAGGAGIGIGISISSWFLIISSAAFFIITMAIIFIHKQNQTEKISDPKQSPRKS